MSSLTIHFELPEDAATKDGNTLYVRIGGGTLKTSIPSWVERIDKCDFQLVMEVQGTSPNAKQ